MDESLVKELLADLKNPDEPIREQATQELWRIWFQQKGIYGLELLKRSQLALEAGDYGGAEALLTEIIESQPDFAEAWNRRAVLHYIQGNYARSLTDCQQVVALNSIHFGALHGMGLCHAAMGNYRAAIRAFRQALAIQPYALVNQKLILECTARLS
ncbi:MAG: tetratricopeptide repeat protein [Elainellaceae cyanobacterium]